MKVLKERLYSLIIIAKAILSRERKFGEKSPGAIALTLTVVTALIYAISSWVMSLAFSWAHNSIDLSRYRGKVLAHASYTTERGDYMLTDFRNWSSLIHILHEIFNHEASLTKEGLEFLRDYYGFDRLTKRISRSGGLNGNLRDQELRDWFASLSV
jgi:hypothetical protein